MANETGTTRSKVTSKQAVLIGVLVTVLIGVVVSTQSGAEPAGAVPETAAPPRRPRAAQPSGPSQEVAKATVWPKVTLDEMLSRNPFAPFDPGPAPTPEVLPIEIPTTKAVKAEADTKAEAVAVKDEEERQQQLQSEIADLKSQKVKLILRTTRGVSAMIGDRKIHEGDVIGSLRIVSIRTTGVVVEPADKQ